MLIYGNDSGNRNISWWHTDNAGLSWTKGRTLMSSDTLTCGMTTRTRNAHPDGQFVFYEEDLTDPDGLYRKMYLWGESGFVTDDPSHCGYPGTTSVLAENWLSGYLRP